MIGPTEPKFQKWPQLFFYTIALINNPPTCLQKTQAESIIFVGNKMDFVIFHTVNFYG